MTPLETPSYDVTVVVLSSGAKPVVALTEELIAAYRDALEDLGKRTEIIIVDDGVGGDYLAYIERLTAASAGVVDLVKASNVARTML